MKMLIAHEMSKEPESKKRPTNLVAKLMGLDALPEQQPNPLPERRQMRGHLQNPLSQPESPPCYRKKKGDIIHEQMQSGIHVIKDRQEYKLMGLDALPEQQPNPLPERRQMRGHLQNPLSQPESPPCYRKKKSDIIHEQMQSGIHVIKDRQEYKDVYEVWQQFPNMSFVEHKSPEKARFSEKLNESRMNLIRQKFTEAKRLATDENLRQSKEFQEALEVLSSNKELFLKFLQEPNSLFSRHLTELQSSPSLSLPKCITVLRPSKSLGNNSIIGCEEMSQKLVEKQNQEVEADLWEENRAKHSFPSQRNDTCSHPRNATCTPPTRIVVLKPSPRTIHDTNSTASFPALSTKQLQNNDCLTESENDESQCSRDFAKEITRKLRKTLSSYSREDTLLSSVCSNGYVGDGSSFNRSDNGYLGEDYFSGSEIMTPTSRVSWDFVNKFESPHSSSFSQASYSPETSVCREAKKRLSERWTMMSSTVNGEEQRQVQRSSSTLGEMLALSETKNLGVPIVEGVEEVSISISKSFGAEQELKSSASFSPSNEEKGESEHDSPRNMLRSRSVPVSSTAYGSRLNVEVPGSDISKSNVSFGVEKSKSEKSSFRGKVSSLFFSKNKKQNKTKSMEFPLDNAQKTQAAFVKAQRKVEQSAPVKDSNDIRRVTKCGLEEGCFPRRIANSGFKEGCLPIPGIPLHYRTASPSTTYMEQKQAEISHEVALSIPNPGNASSSGENIDQPSPNSVLETPFEDDDTVLQSSASVKTELHGSLVNHQSIKSKLIAKSPPIESLARSLASGDASELAIPARSDYSAMHSETVEEQEWLVFIEKLLSLAGTNNDGFSAATFARWHSPQCPLDPKLLEKFINLKDRFQWHEAKPKLRRSKQKLILDSTNEALVDIRKYESNVNLWRKCSGTTRNSGSDPVNAVTAEDIWNQVKEWISGDTQCFPGESEDSSYSLVVDRAVKMEVMGSTWMENMRLEVGGLESEIEKEVLEELVEDVLLELTVCVH